MKLRERTMSEPVSAWLTQQGYTVYAEVGMPWSGSTVDLVGAREDGLIAVELKTTLTTAVSKRWSERTTVLNQANRNRSFAHLSYCAVLSKPRKTSIAACEKNGIGVLRVTERGVDVLAIAQSGDPHGAKVERIRGILSHRRQGGIAGKPNEKGVGPAKTVLAEVRQYKRNNPQATWAEMFGAIPNHYSSKNSMRQAMCNAELREIYRGVIPDLCLSRANKKILDRTVKPAPPKAESGKE